MFRVFLLKNQLIVFDKSEKEFKVKYGSGYEQVSIVKEYNNIDTVVEKLALTYKAEIVRDYKIKKKWGWLYLSPEQKQQIIIKRSQSLKDNYVKTEQHRANLSVKAKRYRHMSGKQHSEETKKQMSLRKLGSTPGNKGMKWMYNPDTGEEKMARELIEGYFWGRGPESKEYLSRGAHNTYRKKR